MKSADEIRGTEYDWLAADAEGFVALFSTAGGGYAPAAFLQDTDAHDAAIEAICALPPIARPIVAPPADALDVWGRVAERGLFAFDSDFHGGPYKRIAIPTKPVHLRQLPQHVRDVVAQLVLPSIRFSDADEIPGDQLEQELDVMRASVV